MMSCIGPTKSKQNKKEKPQRDLCKRSPWFFILLPLFAPLYVVCHGIRSSRACLCGAAENRFCRKSFLRSVEDEVRTPHPKQFYVESQIS